MARILKVSTKMSPFLPQVSFKPSSSTFNDFTQLRRNDPQFNSGGIYPADNFPIINEPSVFTNPTFFTFLPSPRIFWDYFYNNPELSAVITTIAEDIISDGFYIEPIEKESSGKNRIKRAQDFLTKNNFNKEFMAVLTDILITGDGMLYKRQIKEETLRKGAEAIFEKLGIEQKQVYAGKLVREMHDDEDIPSLQILRHIARTTLWAKFDQHGDVDFWLQRVGPFVETFNNDEVVHFQFSRLNGKFYGWSPVQSLQMVLDTMQDMREYNRIYFNRGGRPDLIMMFKNEDPRSPNVETFKGAFRQYTQIPNKFKSLIGTYRDDVKIQELNRIADMQFRELARYLTQVVVMAWGVPAKRLSDLLIEKGIKGSDSDQGYYTKISHYQSMIEETINARILIDFGVKLTFNRGYINDELKEAQRLQTILDPLQKMVTLGVINYEYIWNKLEIPDEFKGEGEVQFKRMQEQQLAMAQAGGKPGQPGKPGGQKPEAQLRDHEVTGTNDEQAANEKRKNTQNAN